MLLFILPFVCFSIISLSCSLNYQLLYFSIVGSFYFYSSSFKSLFLFMSPVSLIFHIKSTVNSCPQLLFVEHPQQISLATTGDETYSTLVSVTGTFRDIYYLSMCICLSSYLLNLFFFHFCVFLGFHNFFQFLSL